MDDEKKKYITHEQKLALVDFVESKPKLIKCKFDSQFTYKDSNNLWEDLASHLNGMAGAKKIPKAWKKCWHDLRRNTKEKAAKIKKHLNGTGGGPILDEEFTDVQEKVITILGPTAIEGHTNVNESDVLIDLCKSEFRECDPICDNIQDKVQFTVKNNMKIPQINNDSGTTKRKMQASARLEKSTNAVEESRRVAEQKLEIKRSYYERKLKLLQRQVEAVEKQSNFQEEALHILKIRFGLK